MTVGERIAEATRSWIGTPYANNAMAKGYGVDCAHLLVGVLIDADLLDPSDVQIEYYSNEWHLHRSEEKFISYIETVATEIPLDGIEVGDFLLYQYGRCISHGAIYVGNGLVVHAFVNLGVVLSGLDDSILMDNIGRSRLRKVYRFNHRR